MVMGRGDWRAKEEWEYGNGMGIEGKRRGEKEIVRRKIDLKKRRGKGKNRRGEYSIRYNNINTTHIKHQHETQIPIHQVKT